MHEAAASKARQLQLISKVCLFSFEHSELPEEGVDWETFFNLGNSLYNLLRDRLETIDQVLSDSLLSVEA